MPVHLPLCDGLNDMAISGSGDDTTNLRTFKNRSEYFPVMVSTIGGSDIALGLDRIPVLALGSVGWL